ncbi:MAG: HEAT repeat domain-containing protein [Chloroflexales bacterium]
MSTADRPADHEPDIRRLEARRDISGLIAALSPERPPALRQAAAQALGQCGGADAAEPLVLLLDDADIDLRIAAAKALWWVGDRRAVAPLCAALTGEHADRGAAAAEALERIGDRRAVGPLCRALDLSGPYRQRMAARALGALGDRRAAAPLLSALPHLRHDAREAATQALDQITPGWEDSAASRRVLPDILAALGHADPDRRLAAAQILRLIHDQRSLQPLLDAIVDPTVETHNWLRGYRDFLQAAAPGSFTIGEIFDGDARSLAPYYPDQLDMYFEFDVAKQIRGAANYGLSRQYMQAVGDAVAKLPFQRWAPFLTNHDQTRAMTEFGDSLPKARLAALALLTLPGLPFVYYGEEIGMLGAKPDERIRTPMQWAGAAGGGFTSGTPWQPLQKDAATKSVAAQDRDPESLLNAYRALINLHTGTPALATGDFTALEAKGLAAFIRQQGQSRALVLINFDSAPAVGVALSAAASGLPAGAYTLQPIYGPPVAAAGLAVGDGGAISGYVPLAAIPPQTGYIFLLTQ